MRVYSQKGGTDCFVFALANTYSYLGKKQDNTFQKCIRGLRDLCKDGPYLGKYEGIYKLGLSRNLEKTEHIEDLQMFGGIACLKHPIFNLHAAFVSPVDIERCMVYNSWLGPAEMCITWRELFRFCRHTNSPHWKLITKDDPKVRRPDIRLANKKLSWFPRVKLYEGLLNTIEYFKNYDR